MPPWRALGLTLDLEVWRQQPDVGDSNVASVPIVELHGDEVPIVLQTQQAYWRRAGSGEAHGLGPLADAGQREQTPASEQPRAQDA